MSNTTKAELLAAKLNALLESNDLLFCNYSKRCMIKKNSILVADGNCLRVKGKRTAFILGTFKAYVI